MPGSLALSTANAVSRFVSRAMSALVPMIRKCVHNHYSDDSEGPRTCPETKRHSQRLEIGLFADDGEGQRMIANKGSGGRGGIRTHEGLAPLAVFKTAALNHSATLPYRSIKYLGAFAAG